MTIIQHDNQSKSYHQFTLDSRRQQPLVILECCHKCRLSSTQDNLSAAGLHEPVSADCKMGVCDTKHNPVRLRRTEQLIVGFSSTSYVKSPTPYYSRP